MSPAGGKGRGRAREREREGLVGVCEGESKELWRVEKAAGLLRPRGKRGRRRRRGRRGRSDLIVLLPIKFK